MSQVRCPRWLLPAPRVVNYESAPPPPETWGAWLYQLAVGSRAQIGPHRFFCDAWGNLWVEGRAIDPQTHDDDEAWVSIERVKEGVRVLSWPAVGRVRNTKEPNRYGHEDIWVVELPEEPA